MVEVPAKRTLPDLDRHVSMARGAIRRERRRLTDERDAYERFAERVRAITPCEGDETWHRLFDRRESTATDRVRSAYRETVMSVPHYSADYDEQLHAHMAAELAPELAAAVSSGSRIHSHLKYSLVEASEEARRTRETVLDQLDEEAQSVDWCAERIGGLLEDLTSLLDQPLRHAEFNTLHRTRERLVSLQADCTAITADRQATLQGLTSGGLVDVEDFAEYLYADCETSHPILSALARIAEFLERTLSGIDGQLARTA